MPARQVAPDVAGLLDREHGGMADGLRFDSQTIEEFEEVRFRSGRRGSGESLGQEDLVPAAGDRDGVRAP